MIRPSVIKNLEIDLIPVGTRIRHTTHRELVGQVRMWHQINGRASYLPYEIIWDEPSRAIDLLGGICAMYPKHEDIEKI
jgi:hypothetical protein